MEKTIWNSLWYDDYDEWKKTYLEFMHDNDDDFTDEDFDEYRFSDWVSGSLDMSIDDERINLRVQTKNKLIICASLGLWHGRVNGVGKILDTTNISDLLFADYDDVHWYCDDKDFKGTMYHHDGRNHYIYRELKDDVDEDEVFNLMYNKEFDEEAMEKYSTSILPYISKVYGWA